MPIPDELLEHLADRYYWECIDSSRWPVEIKRMEDLEDENITRRNTLVD